MNHVTRPMCRPGSMSTHLSEPLKKNLFLQSLYEEEQENLAPMDGINSGKNDKSEIQDKDIVESLESGVQFWTDFSKVHYHPQSLYELNGLWMDAQDFDNYGSGVDVFSEGLQGEEMNERLRFFVEECDHIQVRFLLVKYLDLWYDFVKETVRRFKSFLLSVNNPYKKKVGTLPTRYTKGEMTKI